jgi:membrane fusion protein, multidrug efflux system
MRRMVKWLLSIIVIILLVFVVMHMHKNKKTTKKLPPPKKTRVIAQYICPSSMPLSVVAVGNILSKQQAVLQPKVSGYITKINFKEGMIAKKGQVLITLDDRLQKDAVKQKKIDLRQSKKTYQRYLAASKAGGVSKETLNKAFSDYKNAQNSLSQAKISLQDMTIRAPFNGILGQSTLSVGQYVTPQTQLLQMVDKQHLRVNYSLSSQYLSKSKIGQKVSVTNENGDSYPATVSFVSSNVDPDTQTFSATAMLDKKQNNLLPGLFVHVKQQLGSVANTLMLPGLSVQTQIGSYFVYVVNGNKAQQVAVTLGSRINGSVAIAKGLKKGQLVVTQGADQLKPQSEIIVSKIQNKECN